MYAQVHLKHLLVSAAVAELERSGVPDDLREAASSTSAEMRIDVHLDADHVTRFASNGSGRCPPEGGMFEPVTEGWERPASPEPEH
jgi:hypothetical protein